PRRAARRAPAAPPPAPACPRSPRGRCGRRPTAPARRRGHPDGRRGPSLLPSPQALLAELPRVVDVRLLDALAERARSFEHARQALEARLGQERGTALAAELAVA